MVNAADRQHLRAVLDGGDVPDRLAVNADGRLFRTEIAVGVDFQLETAVTENALSHHRDHIDAMML